jgi:hypothetical protein
VEKKKHISEGRRNCPIPRILHSVHKIMCMRKRNMSQMLRVGGRGEGGGCLLSIVYSKNVSKRTDLQ